MKTTFNRYFYETIRSTLAFLIIFYCLSSVWVYSSAYDSHPLYEVLYMSLLYWAVCLTFLSFKYLKTRQKLAPLFETLRQNPEDVFWSLPNDPSAQSQLIFEVGHHISQAEMKKRMQLLTTLEETEDYASLLFHEMKSPLAIMAMQLSQANDPTLSQSLSEELDRLSHLTEQFLYFSRANDFSKDYLLTEVSVKKLGMEAIKKFRKAILAKQLKLQIHLDEALILTDPKWFTYILEQGISNAIKYSEEGLTISLKTVKDHSGIRVILTDCGRGILAEDLGRIFDRGFTGSTSRGENNATGMGLYLAMRLSQRLGHRLSVRSKPNQGTEFEIYLKAYSELPYKNVSLEKHFEV